MKESPLRAVPKPPAHGLTIEMQEDPYFHTSTGCLNLQKVMAHMTVKLSKETKLAIDKAVRHRGREGHFGTDFSCVNAAEKKEHLKY